MAETIINSEFYGIAKYSHTTSEEVVFPANYRNLVNEVILTKEFTNKFVFEHFFKDINRIDINVDKID